MYAAYACTKKTIFTVSERKGLKGRSHMWKQQFQHYKPFNEQEEADLRVINRCIEMFDDVLTRDNEIAHFTASGFVVNASRDKVLMVHHNIYNSWGWTGGHADGESDFLQVAVREALEETGVEAKPVSTDIFSIDVLQVLAHVKKGKYVTPHIHLNITYLLEASESANLTVAEEENSGVEWIAFDDVLNRVAEEHMHPVYTKLMQKVKEL